MTREELENTLQNIYDNARLAALAENLSLWHKANRHQAQVDRSMLEIRVWYDSLSLPVDKG